jgi:non-specific serine/threonine protein kinase
VALARAEPADPAPVSTGDVPAGGLGDAGPVLDGQAKTAYRSRLLARGPRRAGAAANADAGRIGALRQEIDALSDQLAAAVGLGGRDRRVGSAAERGRVSVTRAISDAIERVREHSPALARYLDASIRTGTFCVYRPPGAGGTWLP